jgi:hypothetical protein
MSWHDPHGVSVRRTAAERKTRYAAPIRTVAPYAKVSTLQLPCYLLRLCLRAMAVLSHSGVSSPGWLPFVTLLVRNMTWPSIIYNGFFLPPMTEFLGWHSCFSLFFSNWLGSHKGVSVWAAFFLPRSFSPSSPMLRVWVLSPCSVHTGLQKWNNMFPCRPASSRQEAKGWQRDETTIRMLIQ